MWPYPAELINQWHLQRSVPERGMRVHGPTHGLLHYLPAVHSKPLKRLAPLPGPRWGRLIAAAGPWRILFCWVVPLAAIGADCESSIGPAFQGLEPNRSPRNQKRMSEELGSVHANLIDRLRIECGRRVARLQARSCRPLAFSTSDDDGEMRATVDEKLRELLVEDPYEFGLQVIEVGGDLESRAQTVLRKLRRG